MLAARRKDSYDRRYNYILRQNGDNLYEVEYYEASYEDKEALTRPVENRELFHFQEEDKARTFFEEKTSTPDWKDWNN